MGWGCSSLHFSTEGMIRHDRDYVPRPQPQLFFPVAGSSAPANVIAGIFRAQLRMVEHYTRACQQRLAGAGTRSDS